MARPQVIETNNDAFSANHFTFQLTNVNLDAPNFQTCEISPRTLESIRVAEAGTGIQNVYHGGVVSFGTLTLTMVRGNVPNDKSMSDLVSASMGTGVKYDGFLVKRHNGTIIRNAYFEGLLFTSEALPTYDNATAAPEVVTYTAEVTYWEEQFNQ